VDSYSVTASFLHFSKPSHIANHVVATTTVTGGYIDGFKPVNDALKSVIDRFKPINVAPCDRSDTCTYFDCFKCTLLPTHVDVATSL